MGAHGKLTSRGRCLKCNGLIAWYKGTGGYELRDPALDAAGNVERAVTVEGGREVSRVVPGPLRHSCAAPVTAAPVPPARTVTVTPPVAVPVVATVAATVAVPTVTAPVVEPKPLCGHKNPSAIDTCELLPGHAGPHKSYSPNGGVKDVWAAPLPRPTLPAKAASAWKRAHDAVSCGLIPRILLYGPPGTAKTEFTYRVAQANKWAYHYQLLTEETPSGDLGGHLIVQGGDTVWSDGVVARAIRDSQNGPVMLCLDEIGRASSDALSYCLLALQNPESMRLVTRLGEVLTPKPENWHVICTSNGTPEELPDPVRDRLHVAIMITHPHPDLVAAFTTIEAARCAVAVSREYSTRALLSYDRLRANGYSLEDAARLVWDEPVAVSFIDAVKVSEGKR